MDMALKGLKVLDFSTLLPGPFATMYLADLGAEVIHIESPTRPDLIRLMPPYANGQATAHSYLNRNKHAVALDLKDPANIELIKSKISDYDIVIEQFRPGVMQRLGLDYQTLSEIIKGKNTSAETLAKAYDYVQQIGKIPIVVNDSRGFFTSRVFGTFVQEGLRLLHEGVHPARIEMAALKAGMPVGPLAIQDEVALTLSEHVANETRKALQAEGKDLPRSGADDVIQTMIHTFDRKGKAAGAGFYDYPEGGKKHLWEGLNHWKQDVDISEQEMIDRFLFVQSLDTLRCYEENVLESVIDANIGSIFGIGFAPWTGGAIQFLNQYGLDQAVQRANELEAKYGERFKAPHRLVESVPSGQIH